MREVLGVARSTATLQPLIVVLSEEARVTTFVVVVLRRTMLNDPADLLDLFVIVVWRE